MIPSGPPWSTALLVLCGGVTAAALTAAAPGPASIAEEAFRECSGLVDSDRPEEALRRCGEAVEGARREEDRKVEGRALLKLGEARYLLGTYEEAIDSARQALSIAREVGDRTGEGEAYGNIGVFLAALGRLEEALHNNQMALAAERELRDRAKEIWALNNVAAVQIDLSRYSDANATLQEALRIAGELGDRAAEAWVLNNLAVTWTRLGRYQTSLEYSERSLVISREVGDRLREGRALDSMGAIQTKLGRHGQALALHDQALAIFRELKDRDREAISLRRSCEALEKLGRQQEEVERFQRALVIARELQQVQGEGAALIGLGAVYRNLGRRDEALALHQDAVVALREWNQPAGEADALRELMLTWGSLDRRGVAVFLGKQAVNAIERIRADIAALDRDAQRGFLSTMETTYRALADLLLVEGRLPEAEQVLALLKDQEYGIAFQGSGMTVEPARVTLTAHEAAAAERFRAASAPLDAAGRALQAARRKRAKTPDEMRRLEELEAERDEARAAFRAFVVQLPEMFPPQVDERAVADAPEERAIRAELRRLGPGTVAIYTLSARDRYHVVLVAPGRRVARDLPISGAELARRVVAFRESLQDPQRDPVPPARELYRLLLGPIQHDLDQAGATVLLWALDGPLRYLPVAALHDDKGWLVERYRNVLFTPSSLAQEVRPPAQRLSVWGFGVSHAAFGFDALPGVEAELRDIIRAPGKKRGLLPGDVVLDEGFTRRAMFAALEGRRRPVVHIASHFKFQPGTPAESFLVLGDGERLTLQELAGHPRLFEGVEVVSLSACETAMEEGEEGAGREVEGFAALAQRQGARAVLATLWPVEDESTRRVMTAFYRLRRSGMGKAEALWTAQLSLLRRGAAGITVARRSAVPAADAPDPAGRSAHPYYWAPFVLSGDAR